MTIFHCFCFRPNQDVFGHIRLISSFDAKRSVERRSCIWRYIHRRKLSISVKRFVPISFLQPVLFQELCVFVGKSDGYGLIHLPVHYGKHKLSIPLFRPSGSTSDWVSSLFWGGNIRYKKPKDMLLKTDNKFPHRTESCGNVMVEINILKTGFPKYINFNSPTQ